MMAATFVSRPPRQIDHHVSSEGELNVTHTSSCCASCSARQNHTIDILAVNCLCHSSPSFDRHPNPSEREKKVVRLQRLAVENQVAVEGTDTTSV